MVGHNWANGLTGSEKEIGNINFIVVILLCEGVFVLIDQTEIGNIMIFTFVLEGAVHHLIIDHGGLIYGKYFFWLQHIVDDEHDDRRQAEKKDGKRFIFFKKR